MKARYSLLLAILLVLIAQMGFAQGDPGTTNPATEGKLIFVSQPASFGRVDVPYLYTAKAISKDSSAVIRYFYEDMTMGPISSGFAIDSITGIVTWTPKRAGWFSFSIMARSDKGEFGFQRFTVAVTSGNGIVQGKVIDTTGVGIPGVVIELLQAVNTRPMNTLFFSYSTKTGSNGNYQISHVDPGKYKLHALSPDPHFKSQWYDGKSDASDADVIPVPDSPATIANFTLRGGPAPVSLISVSGSVFDTLSAPIAGAQVYFVHTGFALNMNSTIDDFRGMFDVAGRSLDFRMDGRSVHVFHDSTNSEGKYTLKVVPGEYIAFARKQGYFACYLVNTTDMLSAKRLTLTKDTTGVDFTLRQLPPVVLGTIQGTVLDTAKGVGVRSRIIAFRDRWTAADLYREARSYTTDTDSLGVYTLGELLPGRYFVLALPMGSYAPAFYTADTESTNWRHATPVLVQGNVVTGIDIKVRQIPVTSSGFAGIRGQITAGGNSGAAAGTIVFAWQSSAVVGFGIADGAGHFEIAGLAPGTYSVSADMPGYDPMSTPTATVSYSQTGSPQYASVNLSMSVVSSVEEAGVTPVTFELAQNYPNPFNPTTAISYQLPVSEKVDLRVFDLLGREVAVLANGVQGAGQHTVNFNATSLSTGMYIYKLSAGTTTATRKMLLLK